MDVARIREYYRESHVDYRLVWQLPVSHGLHAGYYDGAHRTHGAAVENMNRVLAARGGVDGDDRVLDAGCGVGGSAVWLADERGATVQGVDLVPMQLAKARDLARDRGVADRTSFCRADYTDLAFEADAFDVVWAIESVCHADDKTDFVAEAARLLDEGGRLVLADGFRAVERMTEEERDRMDNWLDGWAVPELATVDSFREALSAHGFESITVRDATDRVMPSSRRLYWASRLAGPLGKLLQATGLRNNTQAGNRVAARYQHETLREGLWSYRIVTATR